MKRTPDSGCADVSAPSSRGTGDTLSGECKCSANSCSFRCFWQWLGSVSIYCALLQIVVGLSDLPETLASSRKPLMLALPRSATVADARLLVARELAMPASQLQLFLLGRRLGRKRTFTSRSDFPQVEARIDPVSLLGQIKTEAPLSRDEAVSTSF